MSLESIYRKRNRDTSVSNMSRLNVVSFIIGTLLAIFVISCSESVSGSDPSEQCVLDGSDSTLTCGENRFIVY